jgi:hypothetical protein
MLPTTMRASLSLLAALALAACSSSSAPTDAGPPCAPGSSSPCVGPGGCSGTQACALDGGGYEACVCSGAGFDAGEPDSGAAMPTDGGIQAESGLPCSEPFDCLSGACTPAGGSGDAGHLVCSKPCATAAECGPGWSCGDAGFATPYCICRDGGCSS